MGLLWVCLAQNEGGVGFGEEEVNKCASLLLAIGRDRSA